MLNRGRTSHLDGTADSRTTRPLLVGVASAWGHRREPSSLYFGSRSNLGDDDGSVTDGQAITAPDFPLDSDVGVSGVVGEVSAKSCDNESSIPSIVDTLEHKFLPVLKKNDTLPNRQMETLRFFLSEEAQQSSRDDIFKFFTKYQLPICNDLYPDQFTEQVDTLYLHDNINIPMRKLPGLQKYRSSERAMTGPNIGSYLSGVHDNTKSSSLPEQLLVGLASVIASRREEPVHIQPIRISETSNSCAFAIIPKSRFKSGWSGDIGSQSKKQIQQMMGAATGIAINDPRFPENALSSRILYLIKTAATPLYDSITDEQKGDILHTLQDETLAKKDRNWAYILKNGHMMYGKYSPSTWKQLKVTNLKSLPSSGMTTVTKNVNDHRSNFVRAQGALTTRGLFDRLLNTVRVKITDIMSHVVANKMDNEIQPDIYKSKSNALCSNLDRITLIESVSKHLLLSFLCRRDIWGQSDSNTMQGEPDAKQLSTRLKEFTHKNSSSHLPADGTNLIDLVIEHRHQLDPDALRKKLDGWISSLMFHQSVSEKSNDIIMTITNKPTTIKKNMTLQRNDATNAIYAFQGKSPRLYPHLDAAVIPTPDKPVLVTQPLVQIILRRSNPNVRSLPKFADLEIKGFKLSLKNKKRKNDCSKKTKKNDRSKKTKALMTQDQVFVRHFFNDVRSVKPLTFRYVNLKSTKDLASNSYLHQCLKPHNNNKPRTVMEPLEKLNRVVPTKIKDNGTHYGVNMVLEPDYKSYLLNSNYANQELLHKEWQATCYRSPLE